MKALPQCVEEICHFHLICSEYFSAPLLFVGLDVARANERLQPFPANHHGLIRLTSVIELKQKPVRFVEGNGKRNYPDWRALAESRKRLHGSSFLVSKCFSRVSVGK